jgi:hypothetical protein
MTYKAIEARYLDQLLKIGVSPEEAKRFLLACYRMIAS